MKKHEKIANFYNFSLFFDKSHKIILNYHDLLLNFTKLYSRSSCLSCLSKESSYVTHSYLASLKNKKTFLTLRKVFCVCYISISKPYNIAINIRLIKVCAGDNCLSFGCKL